MGLMLHPSAEGWLCSVVRICVCVCVVALLFILRRSEVLGALQSSLE